MRASCLLVMLSFAASSDSLFAQAFNGEPLLFEEQAFDPYAARSSGSDIRRLQLLPDSLIYHPYLAGPKESRTGIQFFATEPDGWSWYSTVGGQFGILRYGNFDEFRPVGIQLDIEGSAQFRSQDAELLDLGSTGVRFGLPLTIGWGDQQTKLAAYFYRVQPFRDYLLRRGDATDWLFERRALVLGHSIHLTDKFRVYGEVGYAFDSQYSGEWECQFGAEHMSVLPTRIWGAPFAAANVHLFEADDFGGSLNVQAGWGWRGRNARLLRVGAFYSYGRSGGLVLNDSNAHNYGFGFWYDF